MGLIFLISARPGAQDVHTLSVADLILSVIRKVGHITEYAFLYLFLFRAFNSVFSDKEVSGKAVMCSFAVAVLYAISDEVHQLFVPMREGKLTDVAIDCLGMFGMYTFIRKYPRMVKVVLD